MSIKKKRGSGFSIHTLSNFESCMCVCVLKMLCLHRRRQRLTTSKRERYDVYMHSNAIVCSTLTFIYVCIILSHSVIYLYICKGMKAFLAQHDATVAVYSRLFVKFHMQYTSIVGSRTFQLRTL